MSWDVLLQKFPEEVARPEQVPDGYLPPAVGSRAEIVSVLRKLLRGLECDSESSVTLSRSGFTMEISLGDEEQCSQLLLHVHGDGDKARKTLLRIAERFGMRAIDCSTSEFIQDAATGKAKPEVSEQEREDEARYRRLLAEAAKNPAPPPQWPLSGLTVRPCERYIYLSFLPGESPKQQQKIVFRHWGDLFKQHGELPTGISGPMFVLTLPNGESFGDFSVRRPPTLRTETDADMIPAVKEAAALVRAFAAATGRRSGEIETGSVFACDDGQKIPIAQCTYQQLWTDEDYARKVTSKGKL